MRTCTKKYSRFTLIEILVSMGVFAILMFALISVFNSANKAWSSCRSRSDLYENARVAMDLISNDIQSMYYEYEKIPFYHVSELQPYGEAIHFASATSVLPQTAKSKLCEVVYSFYNDTADTSDGWLVRSVTADDSSKYNFNTVKFPPVHVDAGKLDSSLVWAESDPNCAFTRDGDSREAFVHVIPCVVEAKFTCQTKDGTEIPIDSDTMPYSILVELTTLDLNSWNKWKALGGRTAGAGSAGERFLNENKRTFTRLVNVGEKGQKY